MQASTRISIIHPNEIEGEGLRRLLSEAGYDVTAVYRDLLATPISAGFHQAPALVLIKATDDDDALVLCRAARATWPSAKIAVMARCCDSTAVRAAFDAGADGHLSHETSVVRLVEMLKLIALGEKLVPSQVVAELVALRLDRLGGPHDSDLSGTNVSERELEILHGLIQGEPNKIISRRLNITEATVKVHVKSILRKLQVTNRTQAAVWALSRGIGASARPAGSPPPVALAGTIRHLASN